MKNQLVVVVVTGFVLMYSLTLLIMGLTFIGSGGAGTLLGVGLLGILGISVSTTVRELRFGVASERLAREIRDRDGVPLSTVGRDENGRVDLQAAEIEWQRRKAIVDSAPEDWRAWFLLGIAYDIARDRKQARAAIRKAIALHKVAQQA